MTQFIRRDQAEHLFSLAMGLTTETVRNLIDLAKQTKDVEVIRFIDVMTSDIHYGIEIIEKEVDKTEFYEVKVNA